MNTQTAWRPPLAVIPLLIAVLLLVSGSAHADRVKGRFTFSHPTDAGDVTLPINHSKIEIWRATGGPVWSKDGTAWTDSDGGFDVELPNTGSTTYYRVRVYATNEHVVVWPFNTLHTDVFRQPWYDEVPEQVAFGPDAVLTVSRHFTWPDATRNFNLARTLWFAGEYMKQTYGEVGAALPAVNAQTTNSPFAPYFDPAWKVIHMSVGRSYEDYLIAHEYGHFVQASIGSFPFHQGGSHELCVPTNPVRGFMEGFADYYAEAVERKFPGSLLNLPSALEGHECSSTLNNRESTEYFVGAILWDLIDKDTDAHSSTEKHDWNEDGDWLILDLLANELGDIDEPTLWDFRDAWIGRGQSEHDINRIFAKFGLWTEFNHAAFISMSVPSPMIAGQTYPVQVVMRNNGSKTWVQAYHYALGAQSPQDNLTWGWPRVAITGYVEPIKNQNTTFAFLVTAPTKTGTHDFQWQMVQDGAEWFGEMTPLQKIAITGAHQQAQFITQSVPTTMPAARLRTVSVTMRNVGDNTWSAGSYFLGSQNPQDNTTWSKNRVSLPQDIGPGGWVTFTFQVRAPLQGGTYDFQWRMFQEGVGWFGDYTPNVSIFVNDATCDPSACTDNCIQDGCRGGSCNANDLCVCTRCNF